MRQWLYSLFALLCVMLLCGWGMFFANTNGGAPSTFSGTPTPTPTPGAGPQIVSCTANVGTSSSLPLTLTVNPGQGLLVMHTARGAVSPVDPGVADCTQSGGCTAGAPNQFLHVQNSSDGCVYTDFAPITSTTGSDTVTVASPGSGLNNAAVFCTLSNFGGLDVANGQSYVTGALTATTNNLTSTTGTDNLIGMYYIEATPSNAFTNSSSNAMGLGTPIDLSGSSTPPLLGTSSNTTLLLGLVYEGGVFNQLTGFQRSFTPSGSYCGGMVALSTNALAVTAMAVAPTSATLAAGATQQMVATGTLASSQTEDVTKVAQWSSNNTSAATVSASGLVTASSTTAGTATILATYGGQSASSTITALGPAQTANATCFEALTPSGGHTGQWAGAGCTVAFTVPPPPTLNAPIQTFQAGVQHTYGSTTCTPAGDGSTNDSACFAAAVAAGDVDVKPFASGNPAIYNIVTQVTMPANRNIRCETGGNPQGGTVAFKETPAQAVFFFPGVSGGSVYGCQFRGVDFNGTPTNNANFSTGIFLGGANTGQVLEVNDFNGIDGQVGAIFPQGGTGSNNANNVTIMWNTFENCGTNDIEIGGGTNFVIEHNSSLDCSGYVETRTNGTPDSGHLIKWNSWNFAQGTGFCILNGNFAGCNEATAGGSGHCNPTTCGTEDYSSNQFVYNVATGTSTVPGYIYEACGAQGAISAKYFDSTYATNSHLQCPPGFNFSASCSNPTTCSNQ